MLLAWGLEGGLVTTDLTSGDRIILVHADRQLANRLGGHLARAAERAVATVEMEQPRDQVRGSIESMLGKDALRGIELVFPDDPAYLPLMNQLLGVQ